MKTIFMKTVNSKANEPYKFAVTLSLRLDLKILNEHIALQTFLFIRPGKYKTTVQKIYKLILIAPT